MPESEPSTPPVWSAATAKERIAIVTTDAALDARIRAALRDEAYEFVTVPDFVKHQAELTDTILGIYDARVGNKWDVLRYIYESQFWNGYELYELSTRPEICYTLCTMSRLTRIDLTVEERRGLEHGFRHGKTHGFRQRCQMVLLKEQRKPSEEIGHQLGYCEAVVNLWVKRYQSGGLEALHIRKGRGRKAILSSAQDLPAIRRAVQEHRQRLSLAQEALQTELDKRFSQSTLKRFLKSITADTSDYVGG